MNPIRHAMLGVSIVPLLGLGACSMPPQAPASTVLTARLAGSGEVPAVMADATGAVEATLTTTSNVLTWKISCSGLGGGATAAHFHGPAVAGQNAGVAVPIANALASPIVGSAVLTPSPAADLGAGKWCLTLHAVANPGAEIRGQISVRE